MIDLDQPNSFRDVDRGGMIERLLTFSQQVASAWRLGQETAVPVSHRGAENIVICGMGGSAIGGDLTRSLTEQIATAPIAVNRGYELPGYVGPRSLVILSSFSGKTEETLSVAHDAARRGARILAITTGGTLAERARQESFPIAAFAFPGKPREAIGYSTLLMLALLGRLGYVPDYAADVQAAVHLLQVMADELGPDVPVNKNPAKRLAQRLADRMVIIYGGGLMAEVARRWKGQLNENAKTWAYYEQLPELNHNALLGYQFPSDAVTRHLVVLLSSTLNHPRISVRDEVTSEYLDHWGVAVARVAARGATPLEQVLSTVYFGDLVSYYRALLNDVDPNDDGELGRFKAEVEQRSGPPSWGS